MKKLLKLLSASLIMVCCLISSGCSCASPMTITYTISASQGEIGTDLVSNIEVVGKLSKKFREPMDTPCYRKMKKGFVELKNSAEIEQCYTSDCYKKGSDGYEKISTNDMLTISKCITGSVKCYEKVTNTYYKLIEEPDGITACYDADGNSFERATHNAAEKLEIESYIVISKAINHLTSNSNAEKVPDNKNYSLVYEFEITNKESTTIYIQALEHSEVTGGLIKEKKSQKVKITHPEKQSFDDNKFYYAIPSKGKITIKIEVKNLLTSDMTKKTKKLNLNIPIIVK